MRVLVIIPAFNEARSIGLVVNDLPRDLIEEVVVVNNASTDETEENAKKAGATVVREDRQGYGWACLKGMEYARTKEPDVIVFLDGDYSDHPEEIADLLEPIKRNEVDFVIGSRMTGKKEPGAMLPQALLGNRLACWLMWLFWRGHFTDLGPFRAIRYKHLMALGMEDKTYGWTIEMQIKVLKAGYRYTEVPVSYRKRVGVSKITGTISGTLKASYKILWTIAKYAFSAPKLDALEVRKKVPTAR
ncbi:MAG: glycosyltransferase family 2 protein [Rhodothermaceae bacterium]|nr:glycosyltransferase family 2 protein [Rhodothermaceae bacterium]